MYFNTRVESKIRPYPDVPLSLAIYGVVVSSEPDTLDVTVAFGLAIAMLNACKTTSLVYPSVVVLAFNSSTLAFHSACFCFTESTAF